MLGEAALDISAVLRERQRDLPAPDTSARTRFAGITGAAPVMQELYSLIERIAPSDSTVLVQGENGTGKELVARAIHQCSARRDRAFVVANCSAFNDNLLDSGLFRPYARRLHRGDRRQGQAVRSRRSRHVLSRRDRGHVSGPSSQGPARLARGHSAGHRHAKGRRAHPRRDESRPGAMVADGKFRRISTTRINVINITLLPPLRERYGDVALLVDGFLSPEPRARGADQRMHGAAPRLSVAR